MQLLENGVYTPTSPLCAALAQAQTLGPTRGVALLRRDGQRLDVQESASPITDPGGLVTGGVMACTTSAKPWPWPSAWPTWRTTMH